MNKKSILYIFVVLMTLSLALSAVSAAEDAVAADAGSADAAVANVAPATEGNATGGDITPAAESASNVPTADVAVNVEVFDEDDDGIVWAVSAMNFGPDTAVDTMVFLDGSYNMMLWDYAATAGIFDPEDFVWYVGDLAPWDMEILYVVTLKIDEGPYYGEAFIISDTHDPDYSNNFDIAWTGVEDSSVAAAKETTLPATGNPLAVALLALLAIGIGGIKRRF